MFTLILTSFLVFKSIHLSQEIRTECMNFDDQALSFDSIKQTNSIWYPLLTSKDPENKKCERIIFHKNNDSIDFQYISEVGDRVTGHLKLDGTKRLRDENTKTSITYFLAINASNFLITYSCKTYGLEIPVREFYTIYGFNRDSDGHKYVKEFTRIFGNNTKGINWKEIDQNNCKQAAPVANKKYRLYEDDLYATDYTKLLGKWIQKAVNHNVSDLLYLRQTNKIVDNKLETTYYLKEGMLISTSTPMINSKTSERAYQKRPFRAIDYPLYFDGQYLIILSVPTDSAYPDPYFLEVLVRDDVYFNLKYLYDILLNKIRPNARRIIEDQIFNLSFKSEDMSSLQPKSERDFAEEDLIPVIFDKVSNVYELRYSTDPYKVYDIQVSFISGKLLKTYSIDETNLFIIRNVTDYHVFNSKKIFRIINNRSTDVSYLYVDENYLIVYEFDKEENIRLFARQPVERDLKAYKEKIQQINAKTLDKLSDLLPKLQMHSDIQSETII